MPTFLETARLVLKAPEPEDLNQIFSLQSDADVMLYSGGVRTKDKVEQMTEKALQHYKKHNFGFCTVFEKDSGNFIGQAGLIYLAYDDTQPEIEVGYRLLKPYWHKGYGLELAKALIAWGFKNLNVEKIVAVINPDNEKSRRVLEKCNMQYYGRTQYYTDEVAKYEIFKNAIDFSQIKLDLASINEYPIMQNLADFYGYDISEFYAHEKGWGQAPNGRYEIGMSFLKYWETENTYPYLIHYKDELIGFAIVDKQVQKPEADFNMAQFFIVRRYMHKGVGRHVALTCFEKFKGRWEILTMPHNEGAYRFWRAIIREYTQNDFQEFSALLKNTWRRNFITFVSGKE